MRHELKAALAVVQPWINQKPVGQRPPVETQLKVLSALRQVRKLSPVTYNRLLPKLTGREVRLVEFRDSGTRLPEGTLPPAPRRTASS